MEHPIKQLPGQVPTDQIILISLSWGWALIPYTTYRFFVVPSDAPAFDCVIRYSFLQQIETHHTVIQARLDETPILPSLPSTHSIPVIGKLFDDEVGTRMRGVDIQLYLYSLVSIGGGLRSTVLDFLREHSLREDQTERKTDTPSKLL
jgi:hypothetical protein